MTDASTYNVVYSGELVGGFDSQEVQSACASLFKISHDKAGAFLQARRTIKKAIDSKTAEAYKRKLESIGLVVSLEPHTPPQPTVTASSALSLEPVEEKTQELEADNTPPPASGGALGLALEPVAQAQSNHASEEEPAHARMDAAETPNFNNDTQEHIAPEKFSDEEGLSTKSLGVAAAAALVGAIVWNIIASVTGYELGYVAWGIGALIGFAVILTGSSGQTAAIVCGALAFAAIIGGKYMIYSGFQDDFMNISKEDYQGYYQMEVQAAQQIDYLVDEQSKRQFMVDYGYSEASEPGEVTREEILDFQSHDIPRLQSIQSSQPNFDTWYETYIISSFEEVSTLDLVKESLGFIDIIFILLGVGTAYRIALGNDES